MFVGIHFLMTAFGLMLAGDEPQQMATGFFGLDFTGAYVTRSEDGSLDCSDASDAMRLSFAGSLAPDGHGGYGELTDGEVRLMEAGSGRSDRPVVYAVRGDWMYWGLGEDMLDGASHDASFSRWVCAGLGCRTSGDGEIRLRVEENGDIRLLDFHWQARNDQPLTVHAGGEAGEIVMGHCPHLRVRGRSGD